MDGNLQQKIADLVSLNKMIRQCLDCPLHQTRRHAVPGEGRIDAKVFFVGEAPGKVNDEVGRPFVGHGGKIFDTILVRLGLDRNDVFITNAVKCWPPNNRRPRPFELKLCNHFLKKQILLVQPRCIIALGAVAYNTLTGEKIRIKEQHGYINEIGSIPICATFHPNGIRYIKGGRETIVKDIGNALQCLNLDEEQPPIQRSLFAELKDAKTD